MPNIFPVEVEHVDNELVFSSVNKVADRAREDKAEPKRIEPMAVVEFNEVNDNKNGSENWDDRQDGNADMIRNRLKHSKSNAGILYIREVEKSFDKRIGFAQLKFAQDQGLSPLIQGQPHQCKTEKD